MSKRYLFVNKAIQTIREEEPLQRSDKLRIKLLPKNYIQLGQKGDGLHSHLRFSILFDQHVHSKATLLLDICCTSVDGSVLGADACQWRVPGMKALIKNQERHTFMVDAKELKVGIVVKYGIEAMVSVRMYLDMGFNSVFRHSLYPFYVHANFIKHGCQLSLITDERKYLSKILRRAPSPPLIHKDMFDEEQAREDDFAYIFKNEFLCDNILNDPSFIQGLDDMDLDLSSI